MVAKLDAVTAAIEHLPDDLIEEATTRFDEIAREAARRAVGGTMTLHGRGGKRTPVDLGTRFVALGHGTGFAVIVGTPTAMWIWLEKGTQSHPIGIRRDNKAVYLHGPRYAHPIAGPMTHPGARGKGTWTAAVNVFRTEFPQVVVKVKNEVLHAIR